MSQIIGRATSFSEVINNNILEENYFSFLTFCRANIQNIQISFVFHNSIVFPEPERVFYEDQMATRECRLNEEVDLHYQAEMEAQYTSEVEFQEKYGHEMSVMGSKDVFR